MIKGKDRKKVILIASGVVGVLLLGLFGYLAYSDWETLQEVEEETGSLRQKIRKAEGEIRKLPGLEEEVLVLRHQVKGLARILPDDEEVNGFVDKLTQFAASAGVRIKRAKDIDANRRRAARRGGAKEAIERVTYEVEFSGRMSQILKFVDQFENKYERFVRITEFDVSRGSSDQRDAPAEVLVRTPHKVSMTLETYVYTPRTKGQKAVAIRGEDKLVERLRRSGRLEGLDDGLDLEVFDYEHQDDLRDPFVDPRLLRLAGVHVTAEERAAQQDVLTALKEQMEILRERILEEEGIENTVQRYEFQKETDRILGELMGEIEDRVKNKFFTVKEVAEQFHEEVEMPAKLLADAREVAGPPVIVAEHLREKVDGLEALLEAGSYREVVAGYDELARKNDVVLKDPQLAEHFQRAARIRDRAQAHLDFRSLDLRISGSICHAADAAKSVVIINDRSFSPGETVQPGLVVKSIGPGTVAFVFRGIDVIRKSEEGTEERTTGTR